MENKTNTMPEIWRTILVDQKNLHHYDWEENQNGHYMIEVKDYSNLENIKTVHNQVQIRLSTLPLVLVEEIT